MNHHRTTSRRLAALSIALATAGTAGLANAQNYSISSYTIDGGGGRSTDGPYVLFGAIGQPEGDENLTSGAYTLRGGFTTRVAPQLFGLTFLSRELLRLDVSSGPGSFDAGVLIGSTGRGFQCAAADSTDRILAIINNQLLEIDPMTAAVIELKSLAGRPPNYFVAGLAIDHTHNDRMFVVMSEFDDLSPGDQLYTLDADTGNYSLVGPLGVVAVTGTRGLAFSPSGVLYASNFSRGLMVLDQANGTATAIGGNAHIDRETLEFDPTTGICYAAKYYLYRIDPITGAFTQLGLIGNPGPDNERDVRGMAFIRNGRARLTDCDGDGEVGLADWDVLDDCLSGPGVAAPAGCSCVDDGRDGDVDLRDAATFQAALSG